MSEVPQWGFSLTLELKQATCLMVLTDSKQDYGTERDDGKWEKNGGGDQGGGGITNWP
jgi:hypothetical protein